MVEGEVGGAVTFDGRPNGERWPPSGGRLLLGRRGGGELGHRRPCPRRDEVRRDAERGDGGAGGMELWRSSASG